MRDSAAACWLAWWPTFERGAQKVSDKLIELAEIKSGDKVLDIATGIGEPAVTAARKVMPNGKANLYSRKELKMNSDLVCSK
jgi:enediyne biosynthesis protein CalE5